MEVQTSPTPRRYVHRPKTFDPKAELYRDRVKLAREAAKYGLGFEDLVATFNISERDARHIVFGRD
jgi:hypothetical protein